MFRSGPVLETTTSHEAKVWGSSLPVLVTEVLTLSLDTAGEVTVSLGKSGWAWLVSGRRLIVWRYTAGGGRAQCRELSLPPSDLAHRAELCLVYSQAEGGHTPCCLASSPSSCSCCSRPLSFLARKATNRTLDFLALLLVSCSTCMMERSAIS